MGFSETEPLVIFRTEVDFSGLTKREHQKTNRRRKFDGSYTFGNIGFGLLRRVNETQVGPEGLPLRLSGSPSSDACSSFSVLMIGILFGGVSSTVAFCQKLGNAYRMPTLVVIKSFRKSRQSYSGASAKIPRFGLKRYSMPPPTSPKVPLSPNVAFQAGCGM